MPTSEAPAEVNEPKGPAEKTSETGSPAREIAIPGGFLGLTAPLEPAAATPKPASETPEPEPELSPESGEPRPRTVRGSRWIDYDTHELLEMIGELEDERRWSRLREGFWLALLLHILFFSAITWIPMYLFKVPKVVDPFDALKQKNDMVYLNMPPDVLRQHQKAAPKPLAKQPMIDKKTLDELKRESPPPPEQQAPAPVQPKPQAAPPIPPNQQSQSPVEAPRPSAVPARPNFAMGSQNPADQLRQDMQNAMHGHGQQNYGNQPSGGLSMHPGAGTGAPDILSDTQGVDFSSWLARWHYITQMTWDPLIPDEVNPPILKSGVVAIRFKVLPNGQVVDMTLDGRSGDTGLDRAAWGAITGSSYPPLPREFHGPYLELRAYFLYNMQPR
jgi:TonB family protein